MTTVRVAGAALAIVFLLSLPAAAGDFTYTQVTAKQMNEWNADHRFCRAYADDDGNPVLESDLDFAGGVTDDIIKAWIKLYAAQVTSYIKFLTD